MPEHRPAHEGAQRLTVQQLDAWKSLEYGMFLHYGMSTFSWHKAPHECTWIPIEHYNPTDLDVDQWVRVARDAGMRYAILVTKHGTGFCLWPTKYMDYHVGNSRRPTDVVAAFTDACRRHGVAPALYYAGGFPGGFGSPPREEPDPAAHERKFLEAVLEQLEELLTGYGPIAEVWMDCPGTYGPAGRRRIYDHISRLQPQTVIAMNAGFETNGIKTIVKPDTWPTDVVTLEISVPPHYPIEWFPLGRDVTGEDGEPKRYYIPSESVLTMDCACERLWFGGPSSIVFDDDVLLGMRLLCRARKANCVLNVPPTPEGKIRPDYIASLMRLEKNWRRLRS